MTKIEGGLKDGIESYLKGKTTRKFGILVIDEQGGGDDPERTVPQQQVLSMAFYFNMLVVIIELNPTLNVEKHKPTISSLTTSLPESAVTVMKKSFNAFAGDDFGKLRKLPIKEIADLMDCCANRA